MLKILLPYLKIYRHYFWQIVLGLTLSIITLAASVFLLSLSGWFLASTAVAGLAGLYTFNYMLPAAGVRGAAIVRTAARYFERLVDHDATFKILTYLRTLAFKKILPLSAGQLDRYQKADLLNRFIADIDHLDHLYLKLFSPIVTALAIIALLFVGLSFIDREIALVITAILTLSLITLPTLFYQAGKQLGIELAAQQRDYRQKLINYLDGQAELTLFNAREKYRKQLDQLESAWLANQQRQSSLMGLSTAFIIIIIGILTLLVLGLATLHDATPLVALFLFVALSSAEILAPIAGSFIFLGQVVASAKRTNEIFNQQPAITFVNHGAKLDLSAITLNLENITFSYPNQPFAVLRDFSLNVNAGEHIGIIGKTGCGKSTLLSLITREWEPKKGKILFNGISINDLDEATLRQSMAVVPQVITIFSDTLRNNLLLGNPNASDESLIEVLKEVELDKLLTSEEGLDLWLGSSGRTLSGGEMRRIGIARALLHDAPLVLMDEPTESLDSATEQQIIKLIKQTCAKKTVLIVTHRLTEEPLFDRVIAL
ncbi:cysteine/glutathione ABC transporter ATP-binding protein/permease CydC [Orbaceae bacterium ESL0721]|nr:cysteine/glutathione ABC transporter ATP-binding protein/permease CydC [Orbaceae bacterium ESL0721]